MCCAQSCYFRSHAYPRTANPLRTFLSQMFQNYNSCREMHYPMPLQVGMAFIGRRQLQPSMSSLLLLLLFPLLGNGHTAISASQTSSAFTTPCHVRHLLSISGDTRPAFHRVCAHRLSARDKGQGGSDTLRKGKEDKKRIRVTSEKEMCSLLEGGTELFDLDVRGDSYEVLRDREDEHPVLEVLRKRIASGSKPGKREDGLKVGLAIEGGGMRGCVSAGMVAAIVKLGLMDTFDSVYGSSAGSLVGTYAIAAQDSMPRLGCSVYYDALTGPGRHFIDTRYIFRAMGLGLLGTAVTRWRGLSELIRQKYGTPVLKLDYLLQDVVENQRPLDWGRFWAMQDKQVSPCCPSPLPSSLHSKM
ncbi:unnamed protein product [Choristocarpus tenellus]